MVMADLNEDMLVSKDKINMYMDIFLSTIY